MKPVGSSVGTSAVYWNLTVKSSAVPDGARSTTAPTPVAAPGSRPGMLVESTHSTPLGGETSVIVSRIGTMWTIMSPGLVHDELPCQVTTVLPPLMPANDKACGLP